MAPSVGHGVARSGVFLGGVGFGFLRTLGTGVGIFYPTSIPEVHFKYL